MYLCAKPHQTYIQIYKKQVKTGEDLEVENNMLYKRVENLHARLCNEQG